MSVRKSVLLHIDCVISLGAFPLPEIIGAPAQKEQKNTFEISLYQVCVVVLVPSRYE